MAKPMPRGLRFAGALVAEVQTTRFELEGRFGPPHFEGEDDDEPLGYRLVFDCGLPTIIVLNTEHSAEIIAERWEIEHVIRHLGAESTVTWRCDEDEDDNLRVLAEASPHFLRHFQILRTTDDDSATLVERHISERAAQCVAAYLERNNDDATFAVQPDSDDTVLARANQLLPRPESSPWTISDPDAEVLTLISEDHGIYEHTPDGGVSYHGRFMIRDQAEARISDIGRKVQAFQIRKIPRRLRIVAKADPSDPG